MWFTNKNMIVRFNDEGVGSVQSIETEDVSRDGQKSTLITLERLVSSDTSEHAVDSVRFVEWFDLKLVSNYSKEGYVSRDAQVMSFKMSLASGEDLNFLKQKIVIKANEFLYTMDVDGNLLNKDEVEWLENVVKPKFEKATRPVKRKNKTKRK